MSDVEAASTKPKASKFTPEEKAAHAARVKEREAAKKERQRLKKAKVLEEIISTEEHYVECAQHLIESRDALLKKSPKSNHATLLISDLMADQSLAWYANEARRKAHREDGEKALMQLFDAGFVKIDSFITAALARLTSAYTLGGVIGPALGGQLGVTTAARLAVAGSLLAVGLVMLLPSAWLGLGLG